ncbi:MAG: hypothetical protein IJI77_07680 [Erysipelotrichaceae bacterium]|nr:hypothetical protein [Erysipelotrichaceae bacterium]MBQ6126879.1 hypothetical protein [Erysipelotrichaceae bacterium]
MKKVRQTQIYVGLNDSDTYQQKFETGKYVSILKRVCQGYHVAFSMSLINGGYFHDDGTYVEENSLMLTLLDVDEQTIEEIAKDLCAFFNQESVMVSTSEAEVHFVKESIE